MDDDLLSNLAQASGVDLTVLSLRLVALSVSVTFVILVAAFTLAHRGDRSRQARIAQCFALANLFAVLYIGADTAVRLDALHGDLSGTLPKIRIAIATVIFAIAAYVNLYWALASRGILSWVRMARLYAVAAIVSTVLWIDHPALVIAGGELTRRGMSVFADYGALAPWFFGFALALSAVIFPLLVRSPLRRSDRLGWWLNVAGITALYAAGLHDVLRELRVHLSPINMLPLGFACFQVGAFAFLALHYSRTLREERHQHMVLQRLSDEVDRDPATGLFTKQYLQKVLGERDGARDGGLLFVDLDDFKAINDAYGHLVGDAVLRRVAVALRTQLRGDDVPCRWGGDEFLVYLADTGPAQVEEVASRLRAAAGRMYFDEAPGLRLGMSMGYAALTGDHWQVSVARADRALYVSKQNGKNRLTVITDGRDAAAHDGPPESERRSHMEVVEGGG